ncbi:MAG: hypothetical protein WA628_26090, partial [Terriglobales bacterium]
HWHKNSWQKTNTLHRDTPSGQRCCKECWCVNSAATRYTGAPRELPSTNYTTIAAWVRMGIVGLKGQCARTVLSDKMALPAI